MTDTSTAAPPPPEALYIEWRRWLEEDKLFFGRRLGAPLHQCWAEKTPCITQTSPGVPLYGCVECGRSHYCVPPYRTCPRFVPLHSSEAVCPFSGRVLEAADSAHVVGTFDGECALRSAESDVYFMNNGREFDPFLYTRPDELRQHASRTSDAGARARLYSQADEARKHAGVRRDIREVERLAARQTGKEENAAPKHAKNRTLVGVSADRASYDATGGARDDGDGDAGGGDADSLFAANGSTVQLTREGQTEIAYDAAFLERYLEPVLQFIEDHAAEFRPQRIRTGKPFPSVPAALFAKKRPLASSGVDGQASKKSRTEELRLPGENYLFVKYSSPPLPWRVLRLRDFASVRDSDATGRILFGGSAQSLLPHQRQIVLAVRGFLRDVDARATTSGEKPLPPALKPEQYAMRVDRAMMLFNWLRPVKLRINVVDPTQVVRATVMLLSSVLNTDFCCADTAGTVLPVWLADPYLEAAERAKLLYTPFPFASAETASPISRSRTHAFFETLRRLNFSPQRLFALFRDDDDDADN